MRVELFPFQEQALDELNRKIDKAHMMWSDSDPQAISFSAPTGAGKTVIMTALFEEILYGNADRTAEPDSIFIWLSDSPELNVQTRLKIESQSDKLKVRDLVTIDANFSAESLEAGHIYFLNTQKLGSDKLLTAVSDKRSYSIWETITNTAKRFPDKLYMIIDEAHRGTQTSERENKKAQTIMQKFIKGSPEDGLCVMPLVIGVTATPQRFNTLIEGMDSTTIQKVVVSAEDVRESGLLKDKIIIHYPEMELLANMSVLKSAIENWKQKCEHWENYCAQEGENAVNPILVIQVEDGNDREVTQTDMDACVGYVCDALGRQMLPGEIVHTFNDRGTLNYHGVEIRQIDASRIEDDHDIKVVFFKMNLSTGWDCPRAETMMSFRSAQDYTYIAQLLGRMIRTPLARRIMNDAELNNVSLFLPYFNENTVKEVIKALRENDSAGSTEVGTQREFVTLQRNTEYEDVFSAMKDLITYNIDSVRKQPPLKLAVQLSRALTMDGVDLNALDNTQNAIVSKMSEEIQDLKASGDFDKKAEAITGFSMGTFTFDYGDNAYTYDDATEQVQVTDFDIQRHFDQAGKMLGEGLNTVYWVKNAQKEKNDVQIEVIVLAQSTDFRERISAYADKLFVDMYEAKKRKISALPENRKQVYSRLTSSSANPIAIPWQLPQSIDFSKTDDAVRYDRHMYIGHDGVFETSLNNWEDGVIREELENGIICWLRNVDRKKWALEIPYKADGVYRPMYPDIIAVRADENGYVFDILEPHDDSRKDNCPKAVGLAEFAEKHWDKFGRIQLIRKKTGVDGKNHFYRLDLSKLEIRNKVRAITSNGELDRIFDEDSVRED
ncbi:type III restriction enzyme [Butyrivibrio sp. INlla18]|uniref:DEAD/DEAH box helicase n=1 Tax=Butyrivibrio sp. INlla18 TaxID=1520806 RepID=UPI0008864B55|nr:DEAD/DEAH box helicase family protein [Butyrivibrio sp. INlla18]SDA39068.1 type III restriction enzyme [Butyrivibrio sp. INlla18]